MKRVQLRNKVIIGTHHKTGTDWFLTIFKSIARNYGLKLFYGKQSELPQDFDIFLEDHSNFHLRMIKSPYRGVHVIRDPRDIIVSGCFYHQHANEAWLETPVPNFSGKSYKEMLNGFENIQDKLTFEMENASRYTINDLAKWNYGDESFFEIKYEELINDRDLNKFSAIFNFLQFPETEFEILKSIAFENCIFSGKVNNKSHVRSGVPGQWREYFTKEHKVRFVELFGDVLIRLGYESDNLWATSETPSNMLAAKSPKATE